MQRRQFFRAAGVATASLSAASCAQPIWSNSGIQVNTATAKQMAQFAKTTHEIEAQSGGRLGVAVHDTRSGTSYTWRGEERFPMTSTFKFLAAALVMSRVDRAKERLDRPVQIRASDIVVYSPATEPRVGGTMTIG